MQPASLTHGSTLAWPEVGATTILDAYRLELTVDGSGTRAFVRYLDIVRACRGAMLWDLKAGQRVEGAYVDMHRDGRRALRRGADGATALVDLDADTVSATLATEAAAAVLCPDADFAVDRPRANTEKGAAVRAVCRVHTLARPSGAPIRQLATRSVLEAFLARGRLATVGSRGAVTIWDLASGTAVEKLPGVAKPASIRVDRAGTKIALSGLDGRYAVLDADALAAIAEGPSMIIFVGDASFDGHHFVGTNVLLDVESGAAKSHEKGWLAGRRHASPAHEQTVVLDYPRVAVLTQRAPVGDPVVELWDVESGVELGSIAVGPRAAGLATAGDRLVVAHLPGPPGSPALTVLDAWPARATRTPS